MTLPSSGNPLSFDQIRVELGIPTQSPFSLESASKGLYVAINTLSPVYPDGIAPYTVSEWYGYNHSAVCNPLNSGNNFLYSTTTPGDPSDCSNAFNTEYPSSQGFYSSDCSTLAGGCTVYNNSTCTITAYNAGVRYMNDTGKYYSLNASSVATELGTCTT
jgi:hypothetical protein